MPPGLALWRLILREKGHDPAEAMKCLRVAEAGAATRARLAVEFWQEPGPRCEALTTLRSVTALKVGLKRAGWLLEDGTPELPIDGPGAERILRILRGSGDRSAMS